jgi:putative ABC transport system permease protein
LTPTQPDFGRYINEFDDNNRRHVAMIGAEVADKLFNKRDVVGREIKIDGLPFEVIGVAKEQGSFFGQSRDDFIIIPAFDPSKDVERAWQRQHFGQSGRTART